jgi:hypothetical protein
MQELPAVTQAAISPCPLPGVTQSARPTPTWPIRFISCCEILAPGFRGQPDGSRLTPAGARSLL